MMRPESKTLQPDPSQHISVRLSALIIKHASGLEDLVGPSAIKFRISETLALLPCSSSEQSLWICPGVWTASYYSPQLVASQSHLLRGEKERQSWRAVSAGPWPCAAAARRYPLFQCHRHRNQTPVGWGKNKTFCNHGWAQIENKNTVQITKMSKNPLFGLTWVSVASLSFIALALLHASHLQDWTCENTQSENQPHFLTLAFLEQTPVSLKLKTT